MFVELVQDRVMFNLDDLVHLAELHDYERRGAKVGYQCRVALRGSRDYIPLVTSYEEVRNALELALRLGAEADD